MIRISKAGGYIRIAYDGRAVSYPVSRYTVRAAWRDFYRTARIFREAMSP